MKKLKCIYCDQTEQKDDFHFECDYCGAGMCDECYDAGMEHDGHYHRPYESDEWIDKRQPEYVCDQCVKHYKYVIEVL